MLFMSIASHRIDLCVRSTGERFGIFTFSGFSNELKFIIKFMSNATSARKKKENKQLIGR